MAIKPLRDHVLIKQDENEYTELDHKSAEAVKSGTIVLPEMYEGAVKKISPRGTVIKTGPDVSLVEEGDRVYFMQFGGTNVFEGEEKLLLMSQRELLAVIND